MPNPPGYPVKTRYPRHVVFGVMNCDNNLDSFGKDDLFKEMPAGIGKSAAALVMADFNGTSDDGVYEVYANQYARLDPLTSGSSSGTAVPVPEFLSRANNTYPRVGNKAIVFRCHGHGIASVKNLPSAVMGARSGILRTIEDVDTFDLCLEACRVAAPPKGERRGPPGAPVGKVSLLVLDSCNNGMIEVLEQLAPYAEVIVAAPGVVQANGLDYKGWFGLMRRNPPSKSAAWATTVLESFKTFYSSKGHLGERPCTLGAFRTRHDITTAFRALVGEITKHTHIGFQWMRSARDGTLRFDDLDSYDLHDFAVQLERESKDQQVKEKCRRLKRACVAARVGSVRLGTAVKRSNGLSFWFPGTVRAYYYVRNRYKALKFDIRTGWTNYLDEMIG